MHFNFNRSTIFREVINGTILYSRRFLTKTNKIPKVLRIIHILITKILPPSRSTNNIPFSICILKGTVLQFYICHKLYKGHETVIQSLSKI